MKLLTLLNKKTVILSIFFSLMTGLDTLVVPVIVNGIIDNVQSKNINGLLYITLYGILGYFVLQLFLYLWRLYLAKINFEFSKMSKLKVMKYAMQKDFTNEYIENIIYNDIPTIEKKQIEAFLNLIYCIWFSGISLIYVLTLSWQVSLIFIIFSVVPLLLPKVFEKKLMKSSVDWSNTNEQFIKEITELLSGIDVIRHYGRVSYFTNRYLSKLNLREEKTLLKDQLSYKVTFIINAFAIVSGILPFGLGGMLAIKGYLSIGGLVAVFLASDRVLSPLENAINHWNDINSSIPLMKKLNKILYTNYDYFYDEERDSKQTPKLEVNIDFKQATIGYSSPLLVLTDSVKTGDKILIVGPSGSGKTTIFKSIFKDIKILSGSIEMNGKPIEVIEKSCLFSHIGYIPQEIIIFDDSVLFNITMGEKYSDKDIDNAVSQSGLQDFIKSNGLMYQVGLNGEKLSGGEKARIVIARALLREYQILLVDEFSSSLDKNTASKIRDVLLNTNITLIEIAHHYSEEDKEKYDKVWSFL